MRVAATAATSRARPPTPDGWAFLYAKVVNAYK